MSKPICRSCGSPLQHVFCDLGVAPISNAFLRKKDDTKAELFYPLRARVCSHCWLVQLDDSIKAEVNFHDSYAYFSSYSASWLAHARDYVEMMIARYGLDASSKVMEIASNDGYLLQYFVKAGISCLGIEPTANTAAAARQKGVECREWFFCYEKAEKLAAEGWKVDLLLGNNVLAHVPDINDFVAGMPKILKPEGIITLEFPHLLQLINENQFDTIYHEHYSYLSLTAITPIFERVGLRVFDVEKLSTHGGSLRVFLCHETATQSRQDAVDAILDEEEAAGLKQVETYKGFANKVCATKRDLLAFLIDAKRQGKSIVAYGAAAKGNTLLNYCGIGTDFIEYVMDQNPAKQGCLLPGTRIPVVPPQRLYETKPDYVLVLPWNIREEITLQLSDIRQWGGQFVIPIPRLEVVS